MDMPQRSWVEPRHRMGAAWPWAQIPSVQRLATGDPVIGVQSGTGSAMLLRFLFCFALLVVPLPLSRICVGQPLQVPTVLAGNVTDSAGAAIVNAAIILEDNHSRTIAHTMSDPNGQYALSVPVSGVYRVKISSPGFKT